MQGPTELLPVSSTAHVSLIPWLAGWRMQQLDPESRKSFEVALHAGTAAALLIGQRVPIREELRRLDAHLLAFVAMATIPPAVLGYGLERRIERHLGRPGTIAAGLAVGSVAMLWADRAPQTRSAGEVTAGDGLAIGAAQAAALLPGISRNGATVAAARSRGFARSDASLLSRTVALPIILGATVLKAIRMRRRGVDRATGAAMAWGVAASFASTLASQRLISLGERDGSPWPYAAYRLALAVAVAAKLARGEPGA